MESESIDNGSQLMDQTQDLTQDNGFRRSKRQKVPNQYYTKKMNELSEPLLKANTKEEKKKKSHKNKENKNLNQSHLETDSEMMPASNFDESEQQQSFIRNQGKKANKIKIDENNPKSSVSKERDQKYQDYLPYQVQGKKPKKIKYVQFFTEQSQFDNENDLQGNQFQNQHLIKIDLSNTFNNQMSQKKLQKLQQKKEKQLAKSQMKVNQSLKQEKNVQQYQQQQYQLPEKERATPNQFKIINEKTQQPKTPKSQKITPGNLKGQEQSEFVTIKIEKEKGEQQKKLKQQQKMLKKKNLYQQQQQQMPQFQQQQYNSSSYDTPISNNSYQQQQQQQQQQLQQQQLQQQPQQQQKQSKSFNQTYQNTNLLSHSTDKMSMLSKIAQKFMENNDDEDEDEEDDEGKDENQNQESQNNKQSSQDLQPIANQQAGKYQFRQEHLDNQQNLGQDKHFENIQNVMPFQINQQQNQTGSIQDYQNMQQQMSQEQYQIQMQQNLKQMQHQPNQLQQQQQQFSLESHIKQLQEYKITQVKQDEHQLSIQSTAFEKPIIINKPEQNDALEEKNSEKCQDDRLDEKDLKKKFQEVKKFFKPSILSN
ncbi:hypothetical protein PPERSA_11900 [Pseudocohnilembus persalinus]|uniref:Uncharacterized protein n=1 Tax=Pseudocohnilembus persalinus TaxID=266149 RepID=A0A0V0QKH9_PSEPJ|nr:hypothetical protein PPERSA_11900 [Pseudocohnilembus persalinus]|eukprot:KRX02560.1 hypothetical protein PPERSA_11900 [Pseudocohnilembus persalinus]